jgi:hypothetical protein
MRTSPRVLVRAQRHNPLLDEHLQRLLPPANRCGERSDVLGVEPEAQERAREALVAGHGHRRPRDGFDDGGGRGEGGKELGRRRGHGGFLAGLGGLGALGGYRPGSAFQERRGEAYECPSQLEDRGKEPRDGHVKSEGCAFGVHGWEGLQRVGQKSYKY